MTSQSVHSRPRFRFGLRTLFAVVTAIALLLGWFANGALTVRHRRAMLAYFEQRQNVSWHSMPEGYRLPNVGSNRVAYREIQPGPIPWNRRIWGDRRLDEIFVGEGELWDADWLALDAFPEARISITIIPPPASDVLAAAGLVDAWNTAARARDRDTMIQLLNSAGVIYAEEAADVVLRYPARYGY